MAGQEARDNLDLLYIGLPMHMRSKKFKEMKKLYGIFEFMFPMEQPFDDFQEPLDFHGHNTRFVCEVALIFKSIKLHVGVIVFGQ